MAEERIGVTVDASGLAIASLTVSSPRVYYVVTQVSTMAPDVGGSASSGVYLDGMLITPMVAQGDAAAGDPPITLRPGRKLEAVWSGGVVGAQCDALFFYDEVEIGPAATRRG